MSLFHSDNVRIVVVDSSQRYSGTSSNFSIDLNLPAYCGDFDRIALNQISLPRSWYDVATNYNTFTLREGITSVVITVPVGMYNVNSLATTIGTLLSSASPNGFTYTLTYPNSATVVNTNKYTITCSNSATSKQLIFTNSMYQQLGFAINSTNTFTGATLVSTNSISISYINRVFLKTNACSTAQDNILQEILVAGQYPSTSFVYYENINFDINSKEFTNPLNNSWDFSLYDRYGNIVDLNGLEIVFSLIFYKKSKTDELHMEHLRIQTLEKIL
jgi:hypothetical protein